MSGTLHLLAHVAGRGILFEAEAVDSVVELPAVVPVPGAVAAVRGLTALRSRIATVIDLGHLLGLRAAGEGQRAVVVVDDGHSYAIAVDSLEDLADYSIAPPPAGFRHTAAWSIATGVAEGEDETLVVVDPARLVARVTSPGVNVEITPVAA